MKQFSTCSRSQALRFSAIRGGVSALIVASLVLGSGCTVGPNFVVPAAPAPQRYTAEPVAVATADTDVPALWWELFQSPALSRLVALALQNNPGVEAAQAALNAANENVAAQRGTFFPQVSAATASSRQGISPALASPVTSNQYTFNLHTPQLDITYAPDVFGGNRRLLESQQAQAETQHFLYEATRLTLAANVVLVAVNEASLRGQIAAGNDTIELQQRQLAQLKRQLKLGAIGVGDVAAQESLLAQTQGALLLLDKQLALLRNQLSTLIGRRPDEALPERFELDDLVLLPTVPLSLPSRLADHRPDIRAARAQLQAASAQVGVAVAARLPAITLSASAGSSALTLGSLFGPGTGFWAVGAGLTQPLFDAGTLRHRQRAAEALYVQAEAQYRGAVIGAFQNVADALQALDADTRMTASAAQFEDAAKRALRAAQHRFEAGDTGLFEVLSAQMVERQAKSASVQARASRYADTVALLQALGGGWWEASATATSDPQTQSSLQRAN